MKRSGIFLKVLVCAVILATAPAGAQGFQTYHCADGTEFIVAFYPYDPRAFVQIDGREITLSRRLTLFGRRYSSGDVTLKVTRAGVTTIKHARRQETVCVPH
jgi:membrane-bound inhibitor of C-type lysozyme